MPAEIEVPLSELHRTALSAAALRAAHVLDSAEPRIFEDEFALGLTGMTAEEVTRLAARVPAASASTCVLRSRFTEERLAAARGRLNQYVILGAGLDSYALRIADRLEPLIVFEVDDPPFQAWKRQRIEALGLVPPAQLRFVPCNFEQTSLNTALAACGFDSSQASFVSWLGVTQYLTLDAIRDTLSWAAALPKGSEIVLTFLEANAQADNLKQSMATTGVAVLSQFTTAAMTALLLHESGFSTIEHLSQADANHRYFRNRTDGLRAPEIQRLVSATVG